jgi:23S rRNA pseudouridine955/2504/2580 synthase
MTDITDQTAKPGVTSLTVEEDETGMRLDRWFKLHFPEVAFGHLQKLLRTGQVRVNGGRVKADTRLEQWQAVRIPPLGVTSASPAPDAPNKPGASRGISAPMLGKGARKGEIIDDASYLHSITLYEDRDVFVFNKPHGLAVQGGSGLHRHIDGMLPALASQRGDIPRLVHRLDRDTSGVLVVARTRKAAADLGKAFRERETKKIYWALVRGVPRLKQGRISSYLAKGQDEVTGNDKMHIAKHGDAGADHALTYYAVVDRVAEKLGWLSFRPVTGRTHQLRVHAAEMGNPIVGDPKYFNVENWEFPGGIQNKLHLMARRIVLPLPSGKLLDVTAPLPPHMQQSWNLLGLDAKQYDPIEDAPER